ncbi:unnamed protein product, partial [Didymodactylos carnosus]
MQQNSTSYRNRLNDLAIADRQRQQSDEIQKDAIWSSYIKDLERLFMKNTQNYSVDEQRMRAAFVRAKSLTTLRQIDVKRKGYLIQFLYEADLLHGGDKNNLIDLSGADLSGIHLGSSPTSR